MKRIKAALAAGALVVAASTTGVIASSSAQAEMAGWERIEQSGTVPDGSGSETVTAYCTSGKKATGGGYDVGSLDVAALHIEVGTNKATGSGSGWTVTFEKTSSSYGVVVVAVCATP